MEQHIPYKTGVIIHSTHDGRYYTYNEFYVEGVTYVLYGRKYLTKFHTLENAKEYIDTEELLHKSTEEHKIALDI